MQNKAIRSTIISGILSLVIHCLQVQFSHYIYFVKPTSRKIFIAVIKGVLHLEVKVQTWLPWHVAYRHLVILHVCNMWSIFIGYIFFYFLATYSILSVFIFYIFVAFSLDAYSIFSIFIGLILLLSLATYSIMSNFICFLCSLATYFNLSIFIGYIFHYDLKHFHWLHIPFLAFSLASHCSLFKMRHCCVEDPSDLCSVNIAGKEMTDVKEEDLALFDNVAYVNASENYLPFGLWYNYVCFRKHVFLFELHPYPPVATNLVA